METQLSLPKSKSLYVLFSIFLILMICTNGNSQSAVLPGTNPVIYADQYSTIQAAINDLPDKGGLIVLPPGEFEILEPLLITKGDVHLKGSGTSTHIVNKNTNGAPAIQIASDSSSDTSKPKALWRVQISDLRITGNHESGHGILAKNINEIYLTGITVSENGGDGIKLDHCYEDPRISQSLITYNKQTGLNLVGCHDIIVNGNQFEENKDALHCMDGFNLTMTGNNLDDHLGHGVVIENTYGSVLSGNMIEECNGSAIILDRDCYGITLGSNVIAHNGGGIILKDAHGIAVSATSFTLNRTNSIYIGPQSGRITVSGNNFSNSYIGEQRVKRNVDDLEAAGITVDGGMNIVIAGNVFAGLQPEKAFYLQQPSEHILFENNMLIDVKSDHTKLQNPSPKYNINFDK